MGNGKSLNRCLVLGVLIAALCLATLRDACPGALDVSTACAVPAAAPAGATVTWATVSVTSTFVLGGTKFTFTWQAPTFAGWPGGAALTYGYPSGWFSNCGSGTNYTNSRAKMTVSVYTDLQCTQFAKTTYDCGPSGSAVYNTRLNGGALVQAYTASALTNWHMTWPPNSTCGGTCNPSCSCTTMGE